MRVLKGRVGWPAALVPIVLAACGLDTTEPDPVELQVIEELTFAPSLNIDLAAMDQTDTGVYIQDLVVGEGEPLVWGDQPLIRYQGWLANGVLFDQNGVGFSFLMGNNQVILGFEQGIFGMRVGGVRKMIIPPILAYGTRGAGVIPPGSVLIFEVEVVSVVRLDP